MNKEKILGFLKRAGMISLVVLTYIIPLITWVIFVPSFKLLNYVTTELGFQAPGRWKWLGVEVDELSR